ncbi:hypothetical protein T439DRAFT_177069 [Meredithblackwellia eburnea MCA 4105]
MIQNHAEIGTAHLDSLFLAASEQHLATELILPPFIGWLLHLFLFGVVVTNATSYRVSELYKTEQRRNKSIFWVLMTLETVSAGVSFTQACIYGSSQRRDTNTLLLGTRFLDAVPFALCGTTALVVQFALAHRATKFFMSKPHFRIPFVGMVGFMSLSAFAASMLVTILYALYSLGSRTPLVTSNHEGNMIIGIWAFLSAGCDLVITGTLCVVLRGEVRGFNLRTDDIVLQVMRVGMETAATTSVAAVLAAILAVSVNANAVAPLNLFYPFMYPISSLYCLTFIVTLNARGDNLLKRSSGIANSNVRALSYHTPTSQPGTGVVHLPLHRGSRDGARGIWVHQEQEVKSEMQEREWMERTAGSRVGYSKPVTMTLAQTQTLAGSEFSPPAVAVTFGAAAEKGKGKERDEESVEMEIDGED